jgi:hypothetical protein
MTEPRPTYEANIIHARTLGQEEAPDEPLLFQVSDWERNFILRLRQAGQAGVLVTVDPDARCWWVSGRMECNKADRPFAV